MDQTLELSKFGGRTGQKRVILQRTTLVFWKSDGSLRSHTPEERHSASCSETVWACVFCDLCRCEPCLGLGQRLWCSQSDGCIAIFTGTITQWSNARNLDTQTQWPELWLLWLSKPVPPQSRLLEREDASSFIFSLLSCHLSLQYLSPGQITGNLWLDQVFQLLYCRNFLGSEHRPKIQAGNGIVPKLVKIFHE